MKTKHTKGPWIIQTLETRHNGYDWSTFAVRSSPENHCLAVIGDVDRATAAKNEANARLIAAAPELLEACKAVLRWAKTPGDHGGNPYCHEFVKMAGAAIAKAEGEGE